MRGHDYKAISMAGYMVEGKFTHFTGSHTISIHHNSDIISVALKLNELISTREAWLLHGLVLVREEEE